MMLVASLAFFYGFVWPEIIKARALYDENKTSSEMIADINERKDNIRSLDENLGANKDKQSFVESYVPKEKLEERVIDAINHLSSESGVILGSIAIVGGESNTFVQEDPEVSPGKMIYKSNSSTNAGSVPTLGVPAAPIGTNYSISVIGKYENLKIFLDMLNKSDMLNDLASVEVKNSTGGDGSGNAGEASQGSSGQAGVLSAEITMSFYHLRNIRWAGDHKDPIFEKSQLDFSGIEKIRSFISKKMPTLEVLEKGRPNPFL